MTNDRFEELFQALRKGFVEFAVGLALQRGEGYPADIAMRLSQAGIPTPEGTLYPLLNRLKAEGLLTYRWEESPSGPPRKYYRLTEKGRLWMEAYSKAWSRLREALEKLA
jgi:PadR family transcriptional regulator PadR